MTGRTGLPVERIRQLLAAETMLTAPEAVELGFASRVISTEEIAGRRAMQAVANGNDVAGVCDVA